MTHRDAANTYRDLFLAEKDPEKRLRWRRLQMRHVALAADFERAQAGVPGLNDRERAVWKAPCLKGCTVNCGRCAVGEGQEVRK